MVIQRQTKLITALSVGTAILLTGCLESGGKTNKNANTTPEISNPNIISGGTRPIFEPLDTAFPLPSDPLFFLNPQLDGTMLNGTDPDNPVTTGLGFLDGNSILAPFDIKISDSLDPNQVLDARSFVEVNGDVVPNPDQNIYILEIEFPSADSVFQQPGEVGGIVAANSYRHAKRLETNGDTAAANAIYQRLLEDDDQFRVDIITVDAEGPAGAPTGVQDNAIRIQPLKPLKPKTKYVVVLSNEIQDKNGNPLVRENRFETASNPKFTLSNAGLQPFRDVMEPARDLGAAFFNFKRQAGGQNSESATYDDITFAISFTTTAVEDVLLANAAPAAWFRENLLVDLKKRVIGQVLAGDLNFSNQAVTGQFEEDNRIITRIFELLTNPGFRLYQEYLAKVLIDANANGELLRYEDLVSSEKQDRLLAYTLQAAATRAAEDVVDVSEKAAALAGKVAQAIDIPRSFDPGSGDPSPVRFFSQKTGGEVNPVLEQVALDLFVTEITVNPSVYQGEITLPYYQQIPSARSSDGGALQSGSWLPADLSAFEELPQSSSDRISYRFPFAQKQGDVTVPIVVVGPDPSFPGVPSEGYPVIIYQHAATQDRSAILPMATAAGLLCLSEGVPLQNDENCFITVGIDLPLNGVFGEAVTSVDGGIVEISQQAGASENAKERHFGFTAGPDGSAIKGDRVENPESGSLFLNFTNFANTRDNMRQGVLDLLNVNALLPTIEEAISGCVSAGDCADELNINTDRVYFISHSLSGMGGVPFPVVNNLAARSNPDLNPILASVLFNTGGHFSRLAENSRETIAPVLLPTLDAASDGLLAQGRTELNIYFNAFQALLDSVDPVAFAPLFNESGNNATLMTSIVGVDGDTDRPSDGTIPNAADSELYDQGPLQLVTDSGFSINSKPAPLAGTDPMARVMGAVSTGSPENNGNRPIITRYLEGSHGNPVSAGQKGSDPFSSTAVFDEMSSQMVALFRSKTGPAPFTVNVTNTCVVQGVGNSPDSGACEGQTDPGRAPSDSENDDGDNDSGFLDALPGRGLLGDGGNPLEGGLEDLFGGLFDL